MPPRPENQADDGAGSPITAPASTAVIERTAPAVVPEAGDGAGGHESLEAGTLPEGRPGVGDGKPAATSPLTRSQQFERDIAAKKMGPYTTCRLAMFAALPGLVQQKPGTPLLDLIDAAKQHAQETLEASDRTKDRAAQHPWGAIGVFAANVLTQSGVLLTEEERTDTQGFQQCIGTCPFARAGLGDQG